MSSVAPDTAWDIPIGAILRRSEIHERYGGGKQGGMEPSARTPNVLLFTGEGGVGSGYSLYDGWHEDGTFHYTGEGQIGPQLMREGNRAVRDHAVDGRALRLFEKQGAHSRDVMYLGEFEQPADEPFRVDDAPDRNGDIRSVFVFRLQPVGEFARGLAEQHAPPILNVEMMPIETMHVEEYVGQRSTEPQTFLRSEAKLVASYLKWLSTRTRVTPRRHRIPTPGGSAMWTDIFDASRGLLIEAKATATRNDVRTALGQVLDYGRFVMHDQKAILLPSEPPSDMVDLLHAYEVGVIWQELGGTFVERLSPRL